MLGRWKLIEGDGRTRLYDRRADPEERLDVAAAHPVRALLEPEKLAASRHEARAVEIDLSRERLDELRVLGYVERGYVERGYVE